MDTPDRDWVDLLTALLTPTIVLFGSLIAFLQWRTNRNRLKHELFDRRYKQYEAVRDYLGSMLTSGRVENNLVLLSQTRGMEFLFDEDICKFVREIQLTASLFAALNDELSSTSGENRKRIAQDKAAAFAKLNEYNQCLESRFSSYLILKH